MHFKIKMDLFFLSRASFFLWQAMPCWGGGTTTAGTAHSAQGRSAKGSEFLQHKHTQSLLHMVGQENQNMMGMHITPRKWEQGKTHWTIQMLDQYKEFPCAVLQSLTQSCSTGREGQMPSITGIQQRSTRSLPLLHPSCCGPRWGGSSCLWTRLSYLELSVLRSWEISCRHSLQILVQMQWAPPKCFVQINIQRCQWARIYCTSTTWLHIS